MVDLRVFHCPDYTDSNPYQSELARGLEEEPVEVVPVAADGIFPLLQAWLRHGRPDIVHIHWAHRFIDVDRRGMRLFSIALAIRTICEIMFLRLCGIPVVWTVHNVLSHEQRVPRIELLYRRGLARAVNRLIVHCNHARTIIVDRYRLQRDDRITVIPHGSFRSCYPDPMSRCEARSRLDLDDEETVLLFFGLIRPYKQVPALIDRFGAISDPDGRLVVVGNPWDDELRNDVNAAAAKSTQVQTVLEFVPDDQVPMYLSAADAIVLPFDDILTSGSAILGVSFGRAVIAPARGCLPELLGEHGGILFDPASPDGLGEALSTALHDRDRLHTMGDRNRQFSKRMTWHDIGKQTTALYENLTI